MNPHVVGVAIVSKTIRHVMINSDLSVHVGGTMVQEDGHTDRESLLKRTVTFKAPQRTYNADTSFLTKVLGTKVAAPNANRVSESLDYEPIQNKIFYDRMRAKKEGKKKLYG